MEIIRGPQWKDAIHLDNLYACMLTTIQRLGFRTVQKRILEEDAAFTEVIIGAVFYPILKWFVTKHPHAHILWIYYTFIEPVFVYFMAHENVTYDVDNAKVFLLSRGIAAADITSVYDWALANYKPHKSRYSMGKTTFLFYPKATRSVRNLEKDLYIERLRVAIGRRRHVIVFPVNPIVIANSLPTSLPTCITTPVIKIRDDDAAVVDPELQRIEREFLGFLSMDEAV